MFTLNTKLIPELKKNGIRFRYIGGEYDPMTIIITHKYLDICRVDMNSNLNEPYNYCVYWFDVVDFVSCRRDKYESSEKLIVDIKIAIGHLFSGINGGLHLLVGKGEDKMNKKMYMVSDVTFKSSPSQMDEMTFTVNVLNSNCAVREDCDRIKEAIESIGETKDQSAVRILAKTLLRGNVGIKDVIFNNPATIVIWADGTKTVVKAENETFDPEKGLAMAIAKKALGNKYGYYDIFNKYVGRYEKKQKKGGK